MDQHCLTGVSSITGVSGHQILTVKTLRNWASRLEHIDMLCMLTVEEARTLITAHNADALYAQEPGLVHDVLKFSPYLANLPSMPPSQKTLVRQRYVHIDAIASCALFCPAVVCWHAVRASLHLQCACTHHLHACCF